MGSHYSSILVKVVIFIFNARLIHGKTWKILVVHVVFMSEQEKIAGRFQTIGLLTVAIFRGHKVV